MPEWKLKLFTNVVKKRMTEEGRSAAEIIDEYTKLTIDEKSEILGVINL